LRFLDFTSQLALLYGTAHNALYPILMSILRSTARTANDVQFTSGPDADQGRRFTKDRLATTIKDIRILSF
jgi:hypothetical protein